MILILKPYSVFTCIVKLCYCLTKEINNTRKAIINENCISDL